MSTIRSILSASAGRSPTQVALVFSHRRDAYPQLFSSPSICVGKLRGQRRGAPTYMAGDPLSTTTACG